MGDRGVVGSDVQYESLAADYERFRVHDLGDPAVHHTRGASGHGSGAPVASEVLEERWGTTGWDMRVWRMPLARLCEEFADAGFVIERLVEPQPDTDMATVDPATFARLSSSPAFIAFRLRPG